MNKGGRAYTNPGPSWALDNAWQDVTDINIRNGLLFKYNGSIGIYKCPADKSTVQDIGAIPRFRSVSMSVSMNCFSDPQSTNYYKTWHKESDITLPAPSQAFVFVDEHENSIFDGVFVNRPRMLSRAQTPVAGRKIFLPLGMTTEPTSASPMDTLADGAGDSPTRFNLVEGHLG
jgi:hypothetical protein